MFTPLRRQEPYPRTAVWQAAARLRRLSAALAAVICAVLASAAIVPAASASIPITPGGPAVPAPAVPVVTAGGMADWQITLIALGAALVAATAAIVLDRVRTARRAASASTA